MLMPSGIYDRTKAKKSSGHARCIVCNHIERARIELECAAARPDRAIAEQFGLKRDAVHWQNHVSGARKAELICGPLKIQRLAEKSAEEDRSLLDYLGILRSELFHLFLDAKARGLTFDAGSIAARLLQTLEAIGRLNGQLRQAGVVVNNNQINGPIKTETILVSGVLAEGAKTI